MSNLGWTEAAESLPGLLPVSAKNKRILHIDGDSFFASCEIALDSSLEGRPVWVGANRLRPEHQAEDQKEVRLPVTAGLGNPAKLATDAAQGGGFLEVRVRSRKNPLS